jgi:cytochrome c-type biogenesis protein CcmH/NrfG
MNASGGENNEVVRQLLEKATGLDPDCGQAYSLLAMTYIFEWFRTESAACLTKAYEVASRSVAADSQDSWCQFALGFA